MTYEEAKAMYELYCISPDLTCSCAEVHVCQQCSEEYDDIDLLYMERMKKNI